MEDKSRRECIYTSPHLRGAVGLRICAIRAGGTVHRPNSRIRPLTPTLAERALLVSIPQERGEGAH
jgi:hypothetical protein